MRRPASWHQAPHVHRRFLVLRFALVLAGDGQAGDAVEVVAGLLADAVDQQVFLLVHHVLAVVLGHLVVRRQLDRVGRAGFLAQPAVDAAAEVDAEPLGIPAAVGLLGLLQRDAGDRAGHRAQVAGDAALLAVGIAGQHDAAAVAGRQVRLDLGILDRRLLVEGAFQQVPEADQLAPRADDVEPDAFHHAFALSHAPSPARRTRSRAGSRS